MIMCMSDIICVTNRKLCREDFLTRIKRIAACHPAGIILREKDMSAEEYKTLALEVMKLCDRYDVNCILHSFTDVAITPHAQAIHLPLQLLRERTQKQKTHFTSLGASCHIVADAEEAQALGCTYITAGHIFQTDCKKGMPGRGTEFLQNVCNAVDIPVYAIGGIDSRNIALVRDTGADGACLMSSLMVTDDVAGLLKAMEV